MTSPRVEIRIPTAQAVADAQRIRTELRGIASEAQGVNDLLGRVGIGRGTGSVSDLASQARAQRDLVNGSTQREAALVREERAIRRAMEATETLNASIRRSGASSALIDTNTAALDRFVQQMLRSNLTTLQMSRAQNDFTSAMNRSRRELADFNAGKHAQEVGQFKDALGLLTQFAGRASLSIGGIAGTVTSLNGLAGTGTLTLGLYAAAFAFVGTAIYEAGKRGIDTILVYQRIENALRAATGSQQAARQEYEFVLDTARRLGVGLEGSATSYSKLAAASRGTRLEGEETRKVFTAIATASTALGLSEQQTELSLLAVQQMMSKGVVSAEELRRQLGDNLPGAFQIAARAMGVSTAQLDKMIRDGQVLSDDFLPKFAAEIQRAFGPTAQKAAEGLQAAFNRVKTESFESGRALGDFIAGPAAAFLNWIASVQRSARGATTLEELTRELSNLQSRANAFGSDGVAMGVMRLLFEGGELGRAMRAGTLQKRITQIQDDARSKKEIEAAYALERGQGEAAGPGPDYGPYNQRIASLQREAARANGDLGLGARMGAAQAEAGAREKEYLKARATFLAFRDPGSPAAVQASEKAEKLFKEMLGDQEKSRHLARELAEQWSHVAEEIEKARRGVNSMVHDLQQQDTLDLAGSFEREMLTIEQAIGRARLKLGEAGEAGIPANEYRRASAALDAAEQARKDRARFNLGAGARFADYDEAQAFVPGVAGNAATRLNAQELEETARRLGEALAKATQISRAFGEDGVARASRRVQELRSELEKASGAERDNAPLVEDLTRKYREAQDALVTEKIAKLTAELGMSGEQLRLNNLALAEYGVRWKDLAADSQDFVRRLDSVNKRIEEQQELARSVREAFRGAFDDVGRSVVDAFVKGQAAAVSFHDVAQSVLVSLLNRMIQMAAIRPLERALFGDDQNKLGGLAGSGISAIGGLLKGLVGGGGVGAGAGYSYGYMAHGGVIDHGRVVRRYARGGVVGRPTIFPMADGWGLMGEAGAEAVMPLSRTPDGQLGVRAASGGGGGPLVEVHIVTEPGMETRQESAMGNDGRAIERFVITTVKREFGNGGMDSTMRTTYGARRRGIQR